MQKLLSYGTQWHFYNGFATFLPPSWASFNRRLSRL